MKINRVLVSFIVSVLIFGAQSASVSGEGTHEYASSVNAHVVLKTTTTSAGQNISYPRTKYPQVTILHVLIPVGKDTGWHSHPVPGYAYVISGTLLLVTKQKSLVFHQGQGFAESVNVLHIGKNIGTKPLELVVTFLGTVNKPIVMKEKSRMGSFAIEKLQ